MRKVFIKDLGLDMDVKNNGVEFDISDTNGKHLGDLYVTKAQLIWCLGKIKKANGKKIDWDAFAQYAAGLK